MRIPVFLILVFALLYGGMLGYLYLFQRRILFRPSRRTPPKEGFDLDTPEGILHVEVRNPGHEAALVYFPGNTESYWEDPDTLAKAFANRTIYFLHYPGYGASGGSPSMEALYRGALRLYDAIASRHRRIDLVGRSLGSAVAVYLASRRPVSRLVLITPFSSILSLARRRYPCMPVRLLLKDPFPSLGYAGRVHAPVLILLAERDRTVPHAESFRLARAFPGTVRIVTIPGSDHTTIVEIPQSYETIWNFLEGA
ncbi:alpha/beta hydrolase [Nitratifractor sp.]